MPANLLPAIPQLENIDLIKSLQLGLLEFRDGWLYLGWNYQGGSTNTPAIWNEVVVEQFDSLYHPDAMPTQPTQPTEAPELIAPPEPDESKTVLYLQPILEGEPISEPVVIGGVEGEGEGN